MKRFIMFIMIIFTFGFVGLYSVCPPGYTAGQTLTFTPEGWLYCTVTVEWCYIPVSQDNPVADVFISSYTINGDCEYLITYPPGTTLPTVEEILGGIVFHPNTNRALIFGLPTNPAQLTPCDDISVGPDYQSRVFMGACYYKIYSEDPLIQRYEICDPGYWGQCKQYFRYCKRLIYGVWVGSVYSIGQPSALFNCTYPCIPKCQ